MARIRTIKPELFLNEELAELPIYARMLFIGLFTQSDRRGRMEDRPKRLKAALFPYDDIDVDALLASLHSAGFIIRYESGGVKLIQVSNFEKHQRFTGDEAKSESKYPEYQPVTRQETDEKQERNTQETLEKPGKEGKGREGKGDKGDDDEAHATGFSDEPEEKPVRMTVTDVRFLHSSAFGLQFPPGASNLAVEICERFSADAIRGAFEAAAVHNKPSMAYVLGVLNGNGKPKGISSENQKPRGRPVTFAESASMAHQEASQNVLRRLIDAQNSNGDKTASGAGFQTGGSDGGCYVGDSASGLPGGVG